MNNFLAGKDSKVKEKSLAYPQQVKRHKENMIIIAKRYSSTPQTLTA